ncbi:MAG: type II secretion system F family protein [Eubacteriales bacterium]
MKQKSLQSSYISSFCMELYLVLQAGISLAEGVEMLCQGEEDQTTRHILEEVASSLNQGQGLKESLEKTGQFPTYMVDMIGAGEQTGNLDRGLNALVAHYQRQELLEQNVRRAVFYPVMLLTMLTAVLVVLIVEVLPMFRDVYAQLGGTLTGLGALILDFGIFLKANWIGAMIVVALVVIGAVAFAHFAHRDEQRILLSKKLGFAVALSKLASVLAMALQSGLDMDTSITMAADLTQHPGLSQKLTQCAKTMEQGDSLAQALGKEGVFSGLYCRMLEVGTKTGSMDVVMEDIARRCDLSAQDDIDRHVGNLEPTLVMVMSVMVGVVLLSVMLPLASIMTALG